ncbi:MAG: replicative DNA helicase [Chitinophagaceae bacterium]|nr:MAG: replicative DNA helicase [Chitinophagaceae bacterium]
MEKDISAKKEKFQSKGKKLTDLIHDNSFTLGKKPPQAVDAEKIVLGAMLLDKAALPPAFEILTKDSFYEPAHQYIYEAIEYLDGNSKAVDILTVVDRIRKMGKIEEVGGVYYITQLSERIGSTAHIESHARIVQEKYLLRKLINTCMELVKEGYEEGVDAFDLLDLAEKKLFEIANDGIGKDFFDMNSLVNEAIKEIEELSKSDEITGVPTGFAQFDNVTAGFQKSDLIIIAARPGMGKTSFALSVARNAAVTYNKAVALFSLEMSSVQLTKRLISSEAEIPSEKLRKGNLEKNEWAQLTIKSEQLNKAQIFIDDTPAISIYQLRAKCRRMKAHQNIDMVVIDYLQLMTGGGDNKSGNREQEISQISRALKGLAKELNIPVIALSQLSRAVESRGGDKRPQLSDLRESGAIEQDADLVIFLYRPEYYGLHQDEDGNSNKGIAEIMVAKHRNGSLENIKVRFIDQYAKFANLDEDPFLSEPAPYVTEPFKVMPSKRNMGNENPESGTNFPPMDDDAPF